MGVDEEGTHERFKAHLVKLIDPKIGEHHGRIVKTTGDGVLAEFASVVDAVHCAGEIQQTMADRDSDLAEERRLRFREGSCFVRSYLFPRASPRRYAGRMKPVRSTLG